ncbi:hypothetical protein HD806DRAFT_285436 [Xylariaceae sp. AK1471]|nr:hypothetical protein HD806DRAFT_285436 [Xylariaceae sp. AK1471]
MLHPERSSSVASANERTLIGELLDVASWRASYPILRNIRLSLWFPVVHVFTSDPDDRRWWALLNWNYFELFFFHLLESLLRIDVVLAFFLNTFPPWNSGQLYRSRSSRTSSFIGRPTHRKIRYLDIQGVPRNTLIHVKLWRDDRSLFLS